MIPLPLLPWLILAVTLLVGAAGATGYWKGSQHTADQIAAQQAREAALVEKTRETAAQAAAEQIAKIEVRNVTIRQKAETITREVPVYSECKNTPEMMRQLNSSLDASTATDRPANADPKTADRKKD